MQFCRLAETFDQHSLFDATIAADAGGQPATLSVRNVIPAGFLTKRFEAAACCILFSATLSGRDFYQDVLVHPANVQWLDVISPFGVEQLWVRLIRKISTRFRDRAGSLEPISDLIAKQFSREPGNYLVFVNSFDYLDDLFASVASRFAAIPLWKQRRSMSEADRQQFIDTFTVDGAGLGFAVLGADLPKASTYPVHA
jgi:DNA excision repair protein ERCC-2